ncbi:MAG TPA: DmsE family decaheme c-type cytochrome [Terracidiphilus sp.]|nr:DmsE family decaheme c-type cytochrome [Terracidiphilus sp.]
MPRGAVPRKGAGLRACGLFLLGTLWVTSQALAAPAAKPASGQDKQQPAASQYVGSETCATCHEEVAKGFANNPHTRMAQMHGSNGVTCENCHGAGKAHVDGGGDTSKIFNPAKASAKEVDAKCQTCHAAAHPNFDRSPHAKAAVSCVSCHDIHKAKEETALLKDSQPALCYQCHADQKAQFNMPIHHKVNEGVVKCSDCHDTHGTFQANNLRATADQNAICTRCHTDVRGPFVYEHAPVKAEGCTACHTPHGSQNARLLNMPNINLLCNQCHSPVAAATVHSMSAGSSELAPCTACHTYIHGSNMNAAFLR